VTAEEAAAESIVQLLASAVAALYAITGSDESDGEKSRASAAVLQAFDRGLNCSAVLCSLASRRDDESVAQSLALVQECIPRLHGALDRWERDPLAESRRESPDETPYHKRQRSELAMWLETMKDALRYCIPVMGMSLYDYNEAAATMMRDAGATAVALRVLELPLHGHHYFTNAAYSLLLSLFPKACAPRATAAQAAPLRELLLLLCCSLDAAGEADGPLRQKVKNTLTYLPVRKTRIP
jgi:hypothetical protein